MKINPEIFRGYDIRGIVDEDLNSEIVEEIAKAYGTWLIRRDIKSAVVGSDCRLTSDEYRAAIVKGLISTGVDVYDIGMAMVQMVYYGQYHFESKGCVMVTASHNPAEYNGFKLGCDFSITLVSDQIQEVRKLAENEDFEVGEGKVTQEDITDAYINKITEKIKITKKFKILVDYNNATASKFFPKLAQKIGAELIEKNSEIDGHFPLGTPDPTDEKLAERVAHETVEAGADIGMTFDADGDRMGVTDDKGTVVWNDLLVALFAADVLENNPGAKIVYNTLCSKMVEETIKKHGGVPVMWLTGHSFIKEKLKEEKAPFGGELSGHFFFVDKFYGHDDGFYAALRILEYLSRRDKPFSEVIKEFPSYITSPEIKIGCPDDKKVAVVEKMTKEMKAKYPNEKITDIDGVRVDFPDAMFIVRFSQNGPYLSPKFEAKTESRFEEMKKIVNDLLKSAPEIDWSFGVNTESLK